VEEMFAASPSGKVEMFRIAPHIIPEVTRRATEKAVAGIEGTGWQTKFRQAAEVDNLAQQAHVTAKANGIERMAMTAQGVAFYQQAKDRHDIPGMRLNADLIQDPLTRAQKLAELPHDETIVHVEKLLDTAGTPEDQLAQLEQAKRAVTSGTLPTAQPPTPPGGTPHDLSKPIIQNPDGSISTERTITIESNGQSLVIPTIVNGQAYSNEDAIALWKAGQNRPVGAFATAAEADAYAQKRHEEEAILRGTPQPRLPVPLSDQEQRHYMALIDTKEKLIKEEQYQQRLARFDGDMQMVSTMPPAVRRDWLAAHPEFMPPIGIKESDYTSRWNWREKMAKGEDVQDDLVMRADLSQSDYAKLRGMSKAQIVGLIPHFSRPTYDKLVDIWAQIQKGTEVKDEFTSPTFVAMAAKAINRRYNKNIFDDTKPLTAQTLEAFAELERLRPAFERWRRAHPQDVLGISEVYNWAGQLHNDRAATPKPLTDTVRGEDSSWWSNAATISTPLLNLTQKLGYGTGDRAFRDHAKIIYESEAPLVDAAWAKVDSGKMPEELRVVVHASLAPFFVKGQAVPNPQLAVIDAKLAAKGEALTLQNRIQQIVYDLPETEAGQRAKANAEAERVGGVKAIGTAVAAKEAAVTAAAPVLPLQQMTLIHQQERARIPSPDFRDSPAYQSEFRAAQEADYAKPGSRMAAQRAVLAKWNAMKPASAEDAQAALVKKQEAEAAAYREYLKSKGVSETGGTWPPGVLGFAEWRRR
jgi:hypothetical protein